MGGCDPVYGCCCCPHSLLLLRLLGLRFLHLRFLSLLLRLCRRALVILVVETLLQVGDLEVGLVDQLDVVVAVRLAAVLFVALILLVEVLVAVIAVITSADLVLGRNLPRFPLCRRGQSLVLELRLPLLVELRLEIRHLQVVLVDKLDVVVVLLVVVVVVVVERGQGVAILCARRVPGRIRRGV